MWPLRDGPLRSFGGLLYRLDCAWRVVDAAKPVAPEAERRTFRNHRRIIDVVADLHQVAVTGKRPHVEAYAVNRVKNDTEECIEPAPRWRVKRTLRRLVSMSANDP